MSQDITVTDMFCGAGGSTTGATLAGADVRLAINHWRRAIETHNTNYPETLHALTDLHMANPRRFPSTTILIASPECSSHTLAKGKKRVNQQQLGLWEPEEPDLKAEAEERSRCTMWTPLDWAEYHGYQAIILENVVDVHLWRPFQSWLQAWKSLDYKFEMVYLNSMFAHPTPQSRDRMYFVAWKRKNRRPRLTITPPAYCPSCERDVAAVQVWKRPNRRYGKYRQQYLYRCPSCAHDITPYYYAAANAIDWSLPAPRIGDRQKPLREKTLKRIADGLQKFAHAPQSSMIVSPFLVNLNHPSVRPVVLAEQPYATQTAYDATGLVTPPFLLDHLGEYRPRSIEGPCSTICAAGNHHSLVVPPGCPSWLMTYYHHGQLAPIQEAVPTVTTLERHALITHTTHKEAIAVEDCGFRMLTPKEIQAAMAFPAEYVVTGTRREQVKQLGNAVTPSVMKMLMERVIASLA
ncbi:DNA cytosine methyltransferase [Dictyobacter aurantiacus]|uniref:DNA (cytosine-5-)-methyltransferase n=1 Tax=Dictyobacter aurantiacus TaxID=1936993 RepID=A0A401ZGY5_9CHLR|nr:DNA cytosine methyltransferase [Dictyobacter aurantiacus]GCE06150.1 DNA cytosine methyltransferase [Dictyobacter aurantiacus]